MPPLLFAAIWLAGSAAAGDRAAKAALASIPRGLLDDLSPVMFDLADGIATSNVSAIKEAFFGMSGVRLENGERCTDGLVRMLWKSEIEWAVRVTMAASTMMPKEKLAERLEEIASWLRKEKP